MRKIVVAAPLLIALVASTFAQDYAITRLPVLPGAVEVAGISISDNGFISGNCRMANGDWRAFFLKDDVVVDLGSFGGSTTWASAINSQGHIVGYSEDALDLRKAFLWTPASRLRSVAISHHSAANDINESGAVVGTSGADAFVWRNGWYQRLPPVVQSSSAQAVGINDLAVIVGKELLEMTEFPRPAYWQRGLSLLLSGGSGRHPSRINNSGQIIGYRWFYFD
ncbi:MAG: hypothetical protein ACR2HJ_08580 [Fimbriimonadales bacterium]